MLPSFAKTVTFGNGLLVFSEMKVMVCALKKLNKNVKNNNRMLFFMIFYLNNLNDFTLIIRQQKLKKVARSFKISSIFSQKKTDRYNQSFSFYLVINSLERIFINFRFV